MSSTLVTSGERRLTFTVLGEAVGQGRPRFAVVGGHVRAYDPEVSREQKKTVAALIMQAMNEQGTRPFAACMPVKVTITSYRAPAASKAKWIKAAAAKGYIAPNVKPDCDNVIKLILDAMNRLVYADDKQIFSLTYTALFSDTPRTEVEVVGYLQSISDVKDKLREDKPKGKQLRLKQLRLKQLRLMMLSELKPNCERMKNDGKRSERKRSERKKNESTV